MPISRSQHGGHSTLKAREKPGRLQRPATDAECNGIHDVNLQLDALMVPVLVRSDVSTAAAMQTAPAQRDHTAGSPARRPAHPTPECCLGLCAACRARLAEVCQAPGAAAAAAAGWWLPSCSCWVGLPAGDRRSIALQLQLAVAAQLVTGGQGRCSCGRLALLIRRS